MVCLDVVEEEFETASEGDGYGEGGCGFVGELRWERGGGHGSGEVWVVGWMGRV